MRVYFGEAPTTVGWKGLINDPRLDGSFQINEGLRLARRILLRRTRWAALCHRIPRHDHPLNTPPTSDCLGCGLSLHHRTLWSIANWASGPSCPVGFKNGTDGNMRIAVDAIWQPSRRTIFSVTKSGHTAIVATVGKRGLPCDPRGGGKEPTTMRSMSRRPARRSLAGMAARLT